MPLAISSPSGAGPAERATCSTGMQTSQEMGPENGMFLHTVKAGPPFIATESGDHCRLPATNL